MEVSKVEKFSIRKSEVISYVEELLLSGEYDEHHEEIYTVYKWTGKLNKNTYAFKRIIREMKSLWNEKY